MAAAVAGWYLVLSAVGLLVGAERIDVCSDGAPENCLDMPGKSHKGSAMLQARIDTTADLSTDANVDIEEGLESRANMIESSNRIQLLGQQFNEHNEMLSDAMKNFDNVMVASNTELDHLIEDFISKQSGSEDKCSSQLLEAKHQLNRLQLSMTDISMEINHNEKDINATSRELDEETRVLAQYEDTCEELKAKCREEYNETCTMWKILQEELLEMKMIANPSYAISSQDMWNAAEKSKEISSTSTTGVYTSTSGHISSTSTTSGEWSTGMGPESTTTSGWSTSSGGTLLQESTQPFGASSPIGSQTPKVNSVRGLVSKTKALAKDLEVCKAKKASKLGTQKVNGGESLLQVDGSPDRPADLNFDRFRTPPGSDEVDASRQEPPEEMNMGAHGLPANWRDETEIDVSGEKEMTKQYSISCDATSKALASLGAKSRELSTGKPLNPGEHVSYRCQDINSDYEGFVWLMCNAGGGVVVDTSNCFNTATTNEACKQQVYYLEITYVKAYVELTRLVDSYSLKVNETNCDSAIDKICEERSKPVYMKVNKLVMGMTEMTEKVIQVKGRLTIGHEAEQKLTEHVAILQKECSALGATASALDKVRDVISVIGDCPGLRRPEFHIPEWTGEWVVGDLDARSLTDEEMDQKMHAMCRKKGDTWRGMPVRAAETSEIQMQTVEGAPVVNTAPVPLIGTCPNCEGKKDDTEDEDAPRHPSGHARICWDSQKPLAGPTRKDCATGKKAVMCVVDKGDMRKIPA